LVVRAKNRPAILVTLAPTNRGIPDLRQGGRINRPLCLVIPVFSLTVRHTSQLKYKSEFVDRMRKMEFPEFFYLPQKTGAISVPSYARVSELQPVYQPHLEPMGLRLTEQIWSILLGQIVFTLSGIYDGDYAIFREQLLNP
jgi:hypothetical protein